MKKEDTGTKMVRDKVREKMAKVDTGRGRKKSEEREEKRRSFQPLKFSSHAPPIKFMTSSIYFGVRWLHQIASPRC